jgi:hypothetical protein
MSEITYAIEINTEKTGSTNASIGLTTDGYLRYITGRPDYDGTPTYPVWEDDTNNTEVWYEGFIIPDKFSSPNRRIDIEKGGTYGTTSGFSFAIENSMKFWKELEDEDISLINRNITLYVVINDKFYYGWSGIIDNEPFEETITSIKCISNYRKIHKTFPPKQIDPIFFPKAKKSSYGKAIPVCLGNIPFAQLFAVTGNNTNIPLDYSSTLYHPGEQLIKDEDILYNIATLNYTSTSATLKIMTRRKAFISDQLAGNYITPVSGTNAETDKLILILSNTASITKVTYSSALGSFVFYYETTLTLASLFDITSGVYNANYIYTWANDKTSVDDTWWFKIIDARSKHIISNEDIEEFKKDEFNQLTMFNYNNDRELMEDAHGLVTELNIENGRNIINLVSTDIDVDGTITYMVPHGCKFTQMNDSNNVISLTDSENTTDMNKGTESGNLLNSGEVITVNSWNSPTNPIIIDTHVFDFDLENFDLRTSEEIFLGADLDLFIDSLVESKDVGVGFEWLMIDTYERTHVFPTNMGVNYTYEINSDVPVGITDQVQYDFLPIEYYKNGTIGIGSTTSIFGELDGGDNQVREYLRMPDDLKTMIKKKIAKRVRLRLKISSNQNITISEIRIRQLGVFAYQQTKTGNNALFIKCSGETFTIFSTPTNSVYLSFRHILESYDGLSTGIGPQPTQDMGNLSTKRNFNVGWEIGRQITQQQNSQKYLQDLAQYSFVGIFQKRNGILKFSAFLEDTDSVTQAFTQSNINRDSIKNFKKTSILNCYNEFKLFYGYNSASRKFDRALSITKSDESAFPAYLNDTEGAPTEITSPNLTNIEFNGDGTGTITFDADVSGVLSIDDYITYYLHLGDTGTVSANHIYYARVISVSTTVITYEEPLNQYMTTVTGNAQYATIYKHASGTPDWMTFFEGLNSYADAKNLWELCHHSYEKTQIVKNAPLNITKSFWFIDPNSFYDYEDNRPVCPTNSAPFLYLQNLVEWTSRQKRLVSFSLPINSTTIVSELLDYVSFTDPIYTNNQTLYGWITKISINIKRNEINYTLMLLPHDPLTVVNIIETGDAPDTITESGSQPDTITETGV